MDVLVIGGGGREHALVKALKKSPEVDTLYALPGNGGIAEDAVCVAIGAADLDAIVDFAVSHRIGFAVVGPDDPLALGAVDRLHAAGIPCFGPDAKAARIEASKVFSKNLMKKYGIPTADYRVFDNPNEALRFLRAAKYPIVVKADGLALGKGVVIPQNYAEAERAVKVIMEDRIFGASGSEIVVEEFLTGPEVSVLSFTDGKTVVPMVSSMDHKRAGDGDLGPNTGGMGTIAPNPFYTPKIAALCMETIFLPTVEAMREEGCPFKGCLYFGLMLTPDGPKVIEYNCRFGDPETQVVLPLLQSDLLAVMQAVEEERLSEGDVRFSSGAAACVILASGGYPAAYEKGKVITLPKNFPAGVTCYHAGTKRDGDTLVTNGGRVLGITAAAETLEQALAVAYTAAETVSFEGLYYRHDIGRRALAAGVGSI